MWLQAALDLVATQRGNELAERRTSVDSLRRSFELWKTAAKSAERLAGYKLVASSQKDPAKYLAAMERQELELEAIQARETAPDAPAAKSLRTAEAALSEVSTWIAELSAGDRQQPACYAANAATLRARFRTGAPAGCHPLGRPNPQFFNAAAPRTAAQVIVIGEIARCFDNQPAKPSPWGCTANRQLLETLDKQAVLSLLK